MANREHLKIITQGVEIWNEWRREKPNIQPDLLGADLEYANLNKVNFNGALLEDSRFYKAELNEARLRGARLSNTDLGNTKLIGADLSGADISWANISEADFSKANLQGAILEGANLTETCLKDADLTGCYVYGISAWNLETNENTKQSRLVITRETESVVTVDDIEVAQFVYLILNNAKLRNIITTVTSKVVLILGRFTSERKQALEALRKALRARNYVPVIFDFKPSDKRDLTETVQLLANMARFVIADITDTKSIPQELSHIIPLLPSVPVQPILMTLDRGYSMFEHWEGFNSVLPGYIYESQQQLIEDIDIKIIAPVKAWHKKQDKIEILEKEIMELKKELAKQNK